MNKTDVSFHDLNEQRYCQDCKYSFEDESVDGVWFLYCTMNFGCRDGDQVSPWDCCDSFKEKVYKR